VPSSKGTRAITATSLSRAGGKQFVFGILIEDVVDHLHRIDQARARRAHAFHGSQRLMLMPTARTLPLARSFSIARGKRSSSSQLSSQV